MTFTDEDTAIDEINGSNSKVDKADIINIINLRSIKINF